MWFHDVLGGAAGDSTGNSTGTRSKHTAPQWTVDRVLVRMSTTRTLRRAAVAVVVVATACEAGRVGRSSTSDNVTPSQRPHTAASMGHAFAR